MGKIKNQEYSIFNFQFSIKKMGFTLMELLVVIAIITLLAGIMVPNVAHQLTKAKKVRAEAEISAIEEAIVMYETDTGGYFGDIDGTIADVNSALTTDLTAGGNWYGPYTKGIPKDPWDKDYQFFDKNSRDSLKAKLNMDDAEIDSLIPNLDYYILSSGKDRLAGDIDAADTADNINNWDVNKSWESEY